MNGRYNVSSKAMGSSNTIPRIILSRRTALLMFSFIGGDSKTHRDLFLFKGIKRFVLLFILIQTHSLQNFSAFIP